MTSPTPHRSKVGGRSRMNAERRRTLKKELRLKARPTFITRRVLQQASLHEPPPKGVAGAATPGAPTQLNRRTLLNNSVCLYKNRKSDSSHTTPTTHTAPPTSEPADAQESTRPKTNQPTLKNRLKRRGRRSASHSQLSGRSRTNSTRPTLKKHPQMSGCSRITQTKNKKQK